MDPDDRNGIIAGFLARPEIGLSGLSAESLALYDQAFTHRSFSGYAASYERLEFLGDRVLNLIVAHHLYGRADLVRCGDLSTMMEFTRNDHLGACLGRLRLFPGGLIRVGPGTAPGPNIMADIFEAFAGALYLDRGFPETLRVIGGLLAGEIDRFDTGRNYKGMLQEYCLERWHEVPVYEEIAREGPGHSPVFTVRVRYAGRTGCTGTGKTKAEATQDAAFRTLESLCECDVTTEIVE